MRMISYRRDGRRMIMSLLILCFAMVLNSAPCFGAVPKEYWNTLAEYSQVASGINSLFDASLFTTASSAENNANAMNALKKYWTHTIPYEKKFESAILEFGGSTTEFNKALNLTNEQLRQFRIENHNKFKTFTEWKNHLGKTLGISAEFLSLGMEANSFGENLSKAIDAKSNTIKGEYYAKSALNVINAYQTSIEFTANAVRFFPKIPAESWLARSVFAKGLTTIGSTTGDAVLGSITGVLIGAQIESIIYKHLRDQQVTEIKDNLFFQYNDIRNGRVLIISQLIQMLIDKEVAEQPVALGDITDILDTYLVHNPTYNNGQSLTLTGLFNAYTNNQGHLSTNYDATSFNALSDTDKIMVALDALVLMAEAEDAELKSYMYSTITNGVTAADRVFAAVAFEGSGMYEIYNTTDLMNKMFLYNGTDTSATAYYNIIFKALFNSGHAARYYARLAEIGRYSQMLKDAEAEANKPEYLEIQVADKDVAIGQTLYNHTQFYATKGSKVRLTPRNDAVWPDFSAFNGKQINVAVIPYNGINDMHLTLVPGTYANGDIEFTIGVGTTNDQPVILESGYIEVLGVKAVGSTLNYASPKQQITQIPPIDPSTTNTPTTSGLVAKYDFENNANDSSGNSNNGTASGGVTYVPGVYGQAVQFGGSSSPGSIRVPNSDSIKFTNKATISAWIKPSNSGGYPYAIIAKDHDRTGGAMWVATNPPNLSSWFGQWPTSTLSGSVNNYAIGSWKHLAYVFDSTGSKSYLDGQLITQNSNVFNWSIANTRDLYIGKFSDSYYPMAGAIDDLRLYNYDLTAADIQTIYISGQIEILKKFPTTTFLSENLPDGSYQVGAATKTWRFKSGTNAITGLKAKQVSGKTSSGLGITQTEISIGDIAANTEFLVNLPINSVHNTIDVKSSYWTLVDGSGQAVTITNSKNNDFWLKLHSNLAPEFSQLQLESVGGKTSQPLCLPIIATDPDGDALSYSVISGGGSVVETTCMGITGKTYQNNLPTVGVTPVNIRVTDSAGAAADKIIYTVAINANGTVKDFFNDFKYANATTDQLKDQYRAINYLALKGIVIGLPDPNDLNGRAFEPNRFANQAEALVMLMRAASLRGFVTLDAPVSPLANLTKYDPATGTYYNFTWATPYVFKAEQLGLISSATGFEPNKEATREWLATILAALLKLDPPTDEFVNPSAYSFADASSFTTPYDYTKARAASFFGFMGQLGSASSFNPQSSMIRADVAVIVSKVLRRPTYSSIGFSGLMSKVIANENLLSVTMDQSFAVTGIGGLKGNRMLDDGNGNIKEDNENDPNTYVTVKVIRPGMTPYLAGSQMAGAFATSPVVVQSSPPDINYSQKRNLVVLLEAADLDNRNLVRNIGLLPYGVFFPDRDGDSVRDDLDLWPDNPHYASDVNGNGIPENADALWGLTNRNANEVVNINGQSMTIINAVLNGNLASDHTVPTTTVAITGSASPYTVTMSANETATIRYTTNGTAPTTASTLYSTALNLPGGTKLSFYATDLAGNNEAVKTVTIQGTGDTTPPVIQNFSIPTFSNSFQMSITLDATDNTAVTGYCISEIDDANNCVWSDSIPASHTFSAQGEKYLYAFAKDAAGNIGAAFAKTYIVIPNQTLTVIFSGNGFGTITSDPQVLFPAGISCTEGTCSTIFPYGQTVSLFNTPSNISTFGGWGGACSGAGNCNVTMDSSKTVTATFVDASKAKIGTKGYPSLWNAYNEAANGDTIKILDTLLTEELTLSLGKSVILTGGFYTNFTSLSGLPTILKGKLTIKSGTVRLNGIKVR